MRNGPGISSKPIRRNLIAYLHSRGEIIILQAWIGECNIFFSSPYLCYNPYNESLIDWLFAFVIFNWYRMVSFRRLRLFIPMTSNDPFRFLWKPLISVNFNPDQGSEGILVKGEIGWFLKKLVLVDFNLNSDKFYGATSFSHLKILADQLLSDFFSLNLSFFVFPRCDSAVRR